ncbi:MAG: nucleotide exchange factor GrpE [Fusobacterium gastrosuis]|uniref:nucleotide exchange factor GrpE n=1 Tax=Fusobacterium gastrosuis TaxID=1755100 RepID=UPI002A9E2955|nr:nucleotide exchange factor GrpE [Fusobacteriaceae bacterium]MDY5795589.1 nucleotide exchange factor GrpE [Fusobacterium gastrosuis]
MQDNEIKEEILEEKIEEQKEDIPEVEEVKLQEDCGCEEKNEEENEKIIKDDVEKLKAELEDWKQSYMRKQADFQNFSKRKEKELEELRKFSSEKIITKFLGSLDNLERAVEASSSTKDFDSLVKGVEMIIRNLQDIISSEGVEEIKSVGEYDPQYHHAVSVEDNSDFKENEIVRVLQKGYTMKGKVIRPAMVTVKKA